MSSRGSNRRGVALIIVLLMISIIVAVTLQLNGDTRSEVYQAMNLSDGVRLRYVAESGFNMGEVIILTDKNASTALTALWANTDMVSQKSEDYFDNASFKLLIEDEGGKISINSLVTGSAYNPVIRDLLLRLLTGPHFRLDQTRASAFLDAIKDWIDADDQVTGAGAEGAYYAGLERPYASKNAPLDCVEELLMVKGMTRDLFYGAGGAPGLSQFLTVFSSGGININTAPKPLLRALVVEMTDDEVDRLDKYRRDPRNDLTDPGWYHRVSSITIPAGLIVTRSDIFRITSVGLQGHMSERITGVIKRGADRRSIKLLSWKVE
jgi:general secretion pathway protein K